MVDELHNDTSNTGSPESSRIHRIRIEGLQLGYGRGKKARKISGKIECNVSGGELVSLMGRNGSGKSTLLRTIAGLQDPLGGKIFLDGRPIEEFHRVELARMLGFVSTEVIRVEGLRVRDLIAMGRYPHTGWFGSFTSKDHEMVEKAIEMTSLEALRDRDMDELSDGERQRAMIARTLAQDTDILVLDEPAAFLDIGHKYEITMLLAELAREHGKTIVFSTHDLQLSLKESDRLWLMDAQGIIEGKPGDLRADGSIRKVLLEGTDIGGIGELPIEIGE
jgi:iron complex transport system ATP-binding protein